jgi:phosphatidylglycerophosphatase C
MEAAQIAAFDVDGTLTTRDTMLPFLLRAAGPLPVAGAFARQPRLAASIAVGRGGRDRLKAAVLADLLRGAEHEHLRRLGTEHADTIRRRWLRTDAVGRLRWHQRQGHHVVLVSASLRYYLEPLAEQLGADEVLCTELEVGPDGRLTGRLAGENCRGAEKARRLADRYGFDVRPKFAYGNSSGDRELLALAERGIRVSRRTIPAEGRDLAS